MSCRHVSHIATFLKRIHAFFYEQLLRAKQSVQTKTLTRRWLLLYREMMTRARHLLAANIIGIRFFKKPVQIAIKHRRNPCLDFRAGLPKSVNDTAEGSFVQLKHPGQSVLANAGAPHLQL
jgi:hypothetical protein